MMSSLNDRLNELLARKAEQRFLNASKTLVNVTDNTHINESDWMESSGPRKAKVISTWDTTLRVVDSYRLVWAPYFALRDTKVCAVLCDNMDILSQTGRLPKEDEVVVELFNMDREGNRKHSRLLVVYEKDLLSFNGNKRDVSQPIDSAGGFVGVNTDQSWNIHLLDKMHNV